MNNKSTLFHPE